VTPEKVRKMAELCGSIEAILLAEFPGVVARPFGSSACGLALSGSDLDVSVELAELGLDRKARTMALARVLRRFPQRRHDHRLQDADRPRD
jgi:DNA polymerase sigma